MLGTTTCPRNSCMAGRLVWMSQCWFGLPNAPAWARCAWRGNRILLETNGHSICCGLSGVVPAIELVEGNDEPPERPRPKHSEEGLTGGSLLRLTRLIHCTCEIVVLDSGFSVSDDANVLLL